MIHFPLTAWVKGRSAPAGAKVLFDTFTGAAGGLFSHAPEVGDDWVATSYSSDEPRLSGTGLVGPYAPSTGTRFGSVNAVGPQLAKGIDLTLTVKYIAGYAYTSGFIPYVEILLEGSALAGQQYAVYAEMTVSPSITYRVGFYVNGLLSSSSSYETTAAVAEGSTVEIRLTASDRRNLVFQVDGVTVNTDDLGATVGDLTKATLFLQKSGTSANDDGVGVVVTEVNLEEIG